MELSKLLLGAILLGIAVETSSCKKDKSKELTPANKEQTSNTNQNATNHDPCPACGMG